ncbi:class I SAM-dependent methyltransferase [Streptomonospora sediminis]
MTTTGAAHSLPGIPPVGADTGDPYAVALAAGRGPLFLRDTDGGRLLPLEVERWCAPCDPADTTVLQRCEGAVLDVGCGPGRMVAGLAGRGHRALGVDMHPAAVERTLASGGSALCRNVYAPLPCEGGWGTALLVDGNIGIGGSPEALLARLADVVAGGGLLLAEVAGEDADERLSVQFCDAEGSCGVPFAWARVGPTALARAAVGTAWTVSEVWTCRHRSFAALRREGRDGR